MKIRHLVVLMFAVGAMLAVLSIAVSPVAKADTLDPQIFVQQSGSSPAGGGPNVITSTGAFTVGVAGSFTLQNPLLIIVGVYDGTGTPSISFSGCAVPSACPTATVTTYGLAATSATMTSTSADAFTLLGLTSGGSESFTNWSGGDTANGFAAPTSFTLYTFALNTSLTSDSPITIDESGAANGSYVIAYDCKAGTGSSSGCATNGDIGQTVFTNTGLVDAPPSAPEPSAVTLVGLVMLAFIGVQVFSRRKLLA